MTLILHEPLEYPFRGRMTGSSCLVRSVTLGGGLPGWTPEFNRRMVFPQHRRSALGATGANGVVSDGFAECHLEVGHIPGKRWAGGMDSCSVHVSISPPSLLDDRWINIWTGCLAMVGCASVSVCGGLVDYALGFPRAER